MDIHIIKNIDLVLNPKYFKVIGDGAPSSTRKALEFCFIHSQLMKPMIELWEEPSIEAIYFQLKFKMLSISRVLS
ncbi:MAG: hypothetical protein DYG98_27445 [Haliscomenobacteraceae bacterium CHB4]|nr:hypothetical protein [Haliscomenobacteraceae bacterium CHB4]